MHHSASSIGTYLGEPLKGEPGCKRFWHFRYVERIPVKQGDKAALGTRCHKIGNEDYLRDGKAPNRSEQFEIVQNGSPRKFYPGRIVSNILHHLPPAGSVSRVEERLNLTYKGHELLGFVDWQTDDLVGDLKFTSGLDYAKSEADLLVDTQRSIYTGARMLESDDKEVTAQWTYGTFDAKHSKKVRLTVLRPQALADLDRLVPTMDEMVLLAERSSAMDVEPTIAEHTCNAFNQVCPAYDRCRPSAKSRIAANSVTKIGGIRQMGSAALDRLRAARAKASGVVEEKVAPEVAAKVAADVAKVAELQATKSPVMVAGAINPPGEACEPPPDPKAKLEVVAEADAPKRGRGRPRKDGTVAEPKALPAPVEAAPSDVKLATLYVDCFPVKRFANDVELVEASELIEAANAIVCGELDVPHYSLVDWGKGRGALHVALTHVLSTREGTYNVLLSTRSSQGVDALQAFTEAAAVVIRGAA
jgi:hypothetical protein